MHLIFPGKVKQALWRGLTTIEELRIESQKAAYKII